MRDAVGFAQRTSARGRGKVVLVYPAERMNNITANALLKTLEEPPGDVRFVLASEAAWQLLPTIRSRCLGFTLPWPETAEAQGLAGGAGRAAADAAALLRAAGGRPSDALRLARSGQSPKAWSLLPKAMTRGDVGALADHAPAQAVGALQKLCHDLMAVGNGAEPRFFEAGDLPPRRRGWRWRAGRSRSPGCRANRRTPVQCGPDAGSACERSANHPKLAARRP
jgi:DNA polymerase-3 subunit delta'